MDNRKLASYLHIAKAQRARARASFEKNYGPNSATIKEVDNDMLELEMIIRELQSNAETPLEQLINKTKK